MEYDTSAIRAAAKKLDSLAFCLDDVRKSKITGVQNTIAELKGETVNALEEAIDELVAEINAIRKGYANGAEVLYDLARRIDEADQEARAEITKR